MKGLFQCPPWARSFCPFRACGASPYLNHLRKFSKKIPPKDTEISPNHKKIPPKDTEISPKDTEISPK